MRSNSASARPGATVFRDLYAPERDATGGIATVLCVAHDISGGSWTKMTAAPEKPVQGDHRQPAGGCIHPGRGNACATSCAPFLREIERLSGGDLGRQDAYDIFPKERPTHHRTDRKAWQAGRCRKSLNRNDCRIGRAAYLSRAAKSRFSATMPAVLWVAYDDIPSASVPKTLRESNEFLRSVIEAAATASRCSISMGGCCRSLRRPALMEVDEESSLPWQVLPGFLECSDRELAARPGAARAGDFTGSRVLPHDERRPQWWDESVTPILGKHGSPEKLLVASRDITEHKRTQDLRTGWRPSLNHRRMRLCPANWTAMLVTWNPPPTAVRLHGRRNRWPEQDLIVSSRTPHGKSERQTRLSGEWRFRPSKRCGCQGWPSHRCVSNQPGPDQGRQRRNLGISTIFRDITNAKPRREALRKSEERFRQLRKTFISVSGSVLSAWTAYLRESRLRGDLGQEPGVAVSMPATGWNHSPLKTRRRVAGERAEDGGGIAARHRIPDCPPRRHRSLDPRPLLSHEERAMDRCSHTALPKTYRPNGRPNCDRPTAPASGGSCGNVGLWYWDVETGAVFFSRELKQQLGCEDHEFPNRIEAWESRLHPDDRERVTAAIKECLGRLAPIIRKNTGSGTKDGPTADIVQGVGAALEERQGGHMFGAQVDITEREAGRDRAP